MENLSSYCRTRVWFISLEWGRAGRTSESVGPGAWYGRQHNIGSPQVYRSYLTGGETFTGIERPWAEGRT